MRGIRKWWLKYNNWIIHPISMVICAASWKLVENLTYSQIQPIASAISTFAGIMFGFVMASITLISSSKSNTLVRNTTLTGYLPLMLNRMHSTMGWLLLVCAIYVFILFLPDSLKFALPFSENKKQIAFSQIFLIIGIYCLLISFKNFIFTWREFKQFSKNM